MANSDEDKPNPNIENANKDQKDQEPSNADDNGDGEDDSDEGDDDNDDEEEEEVEEEEELEHHHRRQNPLSTEARIREDRMKLDNLIHRLSTEKVELRVHDVIVKGNTKTKEYLIEAELEGIKKASSMQELLEAAGIANAKLQRLEIFDSVRITLDSGPPELPGTSNVIVEVAETKRPVTGECGVYTKPAVTVSFFCVVILCLLDGLLFFIYGIGEKLLFVCVNYWLVLLYLVA